MEPRFVESADHTRIAWYDFGGSGPDLLLSHASGFCALMWVEMAELLRQNFRVVAFDSRGHGRSEAPQRGRDGWDWNHFADDARAVITDAGLEHPFGIGHSSGGATLTLLEEHESTFSKLYLFEPVIFAEDPPRGPWPDRELAVRTRKRRSTFASASEAAATFRARGPFTRLTNRALQAYVDHGFTRQTDGSVRLALSPDDEAEVYVMASAHAGYLGLADVDIPVTLGHGETSTSFTADEVKHLSSRFANGSFEEFDELGHFGPLEAPDRFAAAVLHAFLDTDRNPVARGR